MSRIHSPFQELPDEEEQNKDDLASSAIVAKAMNANPPHNN